MTDNIEETEKAPAALTPEESAIMQRVAGENDDYLGVTEESMEDFSLSEDPFRLPPEAQERKDNKEFAYRWAEMKPQRIDELRNRQPPFRWWVCNSTNSPYLEKHFDPVHRGVQRLDQLLLFKPYWMFMKEQDIKMSQSTDIDRQGDLANRHGIKLDETGSEMMSGPQYKITGKDEVMDPGNILAMDDQSMDADNSGLGDLVSEE